MSISARAITFEGKILLNVDCDNRIRIASGVTAEEIAAALVQALNVVDGSRADRLREVHELRTLRLRTASA